MVGITSYFHRKMDSASFYGHFLARHVRGSKALGDIRQEQYAYEEDLAVRVLHQYHGW
jgi:hypothetical protein